MQIRAVLQSHLLGNIPQSGVCISVSFFSAERKNHLYVTISGAFSGSPSILRFPWYWPHIGTPFQRLMTQIRFFTCSFDGVQLIRPNSVGH